MCRLQADSCCISVVRCVSISRPQKRITHTACRDARRVCKSQPSASREPAPIGSGSRVREGGNMATESKASHGHGDISSCLRLTVTDAHVNIMLMWLICLKIVVLAVLCEANMLQQHVLCCRKKKKKKAQSRHKQLR